MGRGAAEIPPWGWVSLILLSLAVALIAQAHAKRRGRVAKAPAGPKRLRIWPYLLGVGVGLVVGYYFALPVGPGGHLHRPSAAVLSALALAIGTMFVVVSPLLAYVAYQFLRQGDRGVSRAFRRSGGDPVVAEREIRRQIEARGPSAKRAHGLGLALAAQGRWADAYKCFLEAESGGGPLARQARIYQVNALAKLERREDATAVLANVCREWPEDHLLALDYCVLLADLGRLKEARAVLDRVEPHLESTYVLGGSLSRSYEARLDECRRRLAGLKPAATGLADEL